jgi:hypothetical protein
VKAARILLAPSLLAAFAAHAAECLPSAADREWAESALRHWRVVERDALKLAPTPFPKVVAIDAQCTAVATDQGNGVFAWQGTPHPAGTARLPDGKTVPVGPVSFAAPDPAGKGAAYFVMGLPSVWRAKGVKSGVGLEGLMDGVLLHEMAHTRQFYWADPMLARLTVKYKLPDDINDDSLQQAFAKNPEYVRDYETERDLLFASAAASSNDEARALARQALERMKQRRARWFTGANEKWQALDEVFLTMEGLGQWVAYWWFTSPQGMKMDAGPAQRELRRGGRLWTQDEGLALFLVVDRLVPGWQSRVFAPQPALAEALLSAAARR